MIRVLVPSGVLRDGSSISLAEEEEHHLMVRRVASGAPAFALDGLGKTAQGTLRKEAKAWAFHATSVTEFPAPAATILAVAAGDRDRFAQVVEKGSELGITQIIPLETEHSRQVGSRLRATAIDKLRRIALEACKQSGNPWAPTIESPVGVSEFLHNVPLARWFLADLNGEPLPDIVSAEAVGWFIGPEGGFSESELAQLRDQMSPRLVTLGLHMLRFETAACAAAALTADRRRHG